MISSVGTLSELRVGIIAETKIFLRALKSGASEDKLIAIVQRIRDKERQLLKEEGALLDPDMWRILHSRLIKRNIHFVDPNS